MQLITNKQKQSKSSKQITKRKMMKQFAFASLAALTMAAPKISVSYTQPSITIEPCNDAIFKFPMDRRAKDPANNCKGWQPESGIETWDNFVSFGLRAKKRGDVYKHLKLRPTVPSDMEEGYDNSAYFDEETIWLYNDCETDVTKNSMIVKIQNNGCTSLCPNEEN